MCTRKEEKINSVALEGSGPVQKTRKQRNPALLASVPWLDRITMTLIFLVDSLPAYALGAGAIECWSI